MNRIKQQELLTLLLSFFFLFSVGFGLKPKRCHPESLPDPRILRSDQLTVLINGYSEARIPLLKSLAVSYAVNPTVSDVIILWSNPSTSPSSLEPLTSLRGRRVSIVFSSSSSLNDRFIPLSEIRTRAVAIADDDVEIDIESISFAFATWKNHDRSMVGLFARSHDLDLEKKTWIYTVHHDRYSLMLTKFVILKTEYLFRYSCWNRLILARKVVDKVRNCEDILMNFAVAIESGERPLLVQGKRIIDWGDPRNRRNVTTLSSNTTSIMTASAKEMEMERKGLSSRGDHWEVRGWCIREFHRILGVMPLRYSYGRVVEGVEEQGLCHINGNLVRCDKQ